MTGLSTDHVRTFFDWPHQIVCFYRQSHILRQSSIAFAIDFMRMCCWPSNDSKFVFFNRFRWHRKHLNYDRSINKSIIILLSCFVFTVQRRHLDLLFSQPGFDSDDERPMMTRRKRPSPVVIVALFFLFIFDSSGPRRRCDGASYWYLSGSQRHTVVMKIAFYC